MATAWGLSANALRKRQLSASKRTWINSKKPSLASNKVCEWLAALGYSLQANRKRRVGRFDYEYSFRVELTNAGASAENVTATVSTTSARSTITDGEIDFGVVEAGETVMSPPGDTFTIRHNRRHRFDPASLQWDFGP
jgi:hypothetical protein